MVKNYIKKLIATGPNRKAEVEFTPGLNIITGPSNVGKTSIVKCIEYVTGGGEHPFSSSTLYNTITLEIDHGGETVTISRSLDSKDLVVESSSADINSGIYRAKDATKKFDVISTLWLQLMGINPPVEIVRNANFEVQRLSFRSFSHAWIIRENNMNRISSILLPQIPSQNTAFFSALLYLLYEKDFSDIKSQESDTERRIRRNSIKKYINHKLSEFAQHQDDLERELREKNIVDFEEEIGQLTSKLNHVRTVMAEVNDQNKNLLEQISEIDEELSESQLLLNRFQDLQTQYLSDLERLSFIVETHKLLETTENVAVCPLCSHDISDSNVESHRSSINSEVHNLASKLKNLDETISQIKSNITSLSNKKIELTAQRDALTTELKTIFIPDERNINHKIQQYKNYIQVKRDIDNINKVVQDWEKDITEIDNEKKESISYSPRDEFLHTFWSEMTANIKTILQECTFDKATFARFDRSLFDITVSGEQKNDKYGKGFIAFLNTVVVLALRKYFNEHAVYKPFFHIIDTPLLGLDEGELNNTPESMQIGLFNYFIQSEDEGQLIVVENSRNLPRIPYDKVNIIEFTKNDENGRYGFLNGVED
ncbi:TPA: hypothetical protein ACGO54_000166 [Streptococcus suis]